MKSRKLWFFTIAGVILTTLFVNGTLSENGFVNLITIVLLGYAGGNVGEWAARRS